MPPGLKFERIADIERNMNSAYYYLFLSSATAAVGQILLKLGAGRGGWDMLRAPQLWCGGFCYFIGSGCGFTPFQKWNWARPIHSRP